MPNQWVLKCKENKRNGYIVYTFGSGVYRVTLLQDATLITDQLFDIYQRTITDLAKDRGYTNLQWKKVKVELEYPNRN